MKQIVDKIEVLQNQSFEGWSEDAIAGYMTAMETVKKLIRQASPKEEEVPFPDVEFDVLHREGMEEEMKIRI